MAYAEPRAWTAEREAQLPDTYPELGVSDAQGVLQTDGYTVANGGAPTSFSQNMMALANHATLQFNDPNNPPLNPDFPDAVPNVSGAVGNSAAAANQQPYQFGALDPWGDEPWLQLPDELLQANGIDPHLHSTWGRGYPDPLSTGRGEGQLPLDLLPTDPPARPAESWAISGVYPAMMVGPSVPAPEPTPEFPDAVPNVRPFARPPTHGFDLGATLRQGLTKAVDVTNPNILFSSVLPKLGIDTSGLPWYLRDPLNLATTPLSFAGGGGGGLVRGLGAAIGGAAGAGLTGGAVHQALPADMNPFLRGALELAGGLPGAVIGGGAGEIAADAGAALAGRSWQSVAKQAALEAERAAAPEAFQYGRGNITGAGELRATAIRPEDVIPRRTVVMPSGNINAGVSGGAEITQADVDNLVSRLVREGKTPQEIMRDPEFQDAQAQVFARNPEPTPGEQMTQDLLRDEGALRGESRLQQMEQTRQQFAAQQQPQASVEERIGAIPRTDPRYGQALATRELMLRAEANGDTAGAQRYRQQLDAVLSAGEVPRFPFTGQAGGAEVPQQPELLPPGAGGVRDSYPAQTTTNVEQPPSDDELRAAVIAARNAEALAGSTGGPGGPAGRTPLPEESAPNWRIPTTLADVNNSIRSTNTLLDFAFMGRLGGQAGLMHPATYVRAVGQAWKSLADPEIVNKVWANLDERAARSGYLPDVETMRRDYGLRAYNSDTNPGILGKVPVLGRAAKVYQNFQALLRPQMLQTEIENQVNAGSLSAEDLQDPHVQRDLGRSINLLTGATSLHIGNDANLLLEFPNWLAAQGELIFRAFGRGSITSDMARQSLMRLVAFGTAATAATSLAAGKPPVVKNGVPMAHIPGTDLTIDFYGPLGELVSKAGGIIVGGVQGAQGQHGMAGGVEGAVQGAGRAAFQAYRGLSSPLASIAIDQISGKDFIGRPVSTPKQRIENLIEHVLPFNVSGAMSDREPAAQVLGGAGLRVHQPSTSAKVAEGNYADLKPEQQPQGIRNEAWRILSTAQGAPESVKQYPSYYAWADAERARLTPLVASRYQEHGQSVTQKEIDTTVQGLIDKEPEAKAWSNARTLLKDRWIHDNPQLALDLYDKNPKYGQAGYDSDLSLTKKQLEAAHARLAELKQPAGVH